jgi:DNA polymerase/3'-5' exonuclease PolX
MKTKFPRAVAIDVAREILAVLTPACSRIMVAGSLRRRKAEVGDVEILYIPNIVQLPDPGDFFGKKTPTNAGDVALNACLTVGLITKRLNVKEHQTWGPNNKLATHAPSGVPVDLFTATPENWWNLVVARTGGMRSNIQICEGAIRGGWKWNPYGEGFSRPNPERNGYSLIKPMHCEEEVFHFAGLEYHDPWERE